MTKEQVIETALNLGWEDLGPQKSGHLTSFTRGDHRANFYESTGTLTIQDKRFIHDSGKTYKKVTLEEIKNILK